MVFTSRLEQRRGVLLLQEPRPPGPGRLGLPHLVLGEALPPLAWLATTPGHQPRHPRGFGLRVGSELFLTLRPLHFLVFRQFQIRKFFRHFLVLFFFVFALLVFVLSSIIFTEVPESLLYGPVFILDFGILVFRLLGFLLLLSSETGFIGIAAKWF